MAEQFGLQQLLGNGATVDGNERAVGTETSLVNGTRQYLLASTALATDQHAGVGSGHHARFGHQIGHFGTAIDQPIRPFLAGHAGLGQRRVGIDGRRNGQRLVDFFEQDLTVEGFGQITENTAGSRVDRIGNGAVRRKQNYRQSGPAVSQLFKKRQTVDARQANIAHHHPRRINRDPGQRCLGRTFGADPKSTRLEAHDQQTQDIFVVIDDQYMGSQSFARCHRPSPFPAGSRCCRGRTVRLRSMPARPSSFS